MDWSHFAESGLTINDIHAGDVLWHCASWLDPNVEFVRVRAVERTRSRWRLEPVDTPDLAKHSAFAKDLWTDAQIATARDYRARDHAIATAERAQPCDETQQRAIECVLMIFNGGSSFPDAAQTEHLLQQAGRPAELEALHPSAYAPTQAGWSEVFAPDAAWLSLCRDLAAAHPQPIAERIEDIIESNRGLFGEHHAAAMRLVCRWASIDAPGNDAPTPGEHGEVVRLRALVELAADKLDAAGDLAGALQIRRAAFPHRFASDE